MRDNANFFYFEMFKKRMKEKIKAYLFDFLKNENFWRI